MKYTSKEIMKWPNPYETFNKTDGLYGENLDTLNELSDKHKEKVDLATKIIHACPKTDLNPLRKKLEALNVNGKNSFYSVITQAYEVKQSLIGLVDPRNKNPHNLFLGKEFNSGVYAQFGELAQLTLKGSESGLAEKLALKTPADQRSELARNIAIAFPDSLFAKKIGTAMTLVHQLETLLLGAHPEQFFSSPDFNTEICKEFLNLSATTLKGQEKAIGDKLSELALATQAQLRRKLQLLSSTTHDAANPFKLIIDVMPYQPTNISTNPNTLYGKSEKEPYSPALQQSTSLNSEASTIDVMPNQPTNLSTNPNTLYGKSGKEPYSPALQQSTSPNSEASTDEDNTDHLSDEELFYEASQLTSISYSF